MLSPSQSLRVLVSTWRRGFKSHFWHKLFLNWNRFWDRKHYILYCYFAIWPMQIFNILVLECQNGHSAITPNSRRYLLLSCWGFWSPHGGVGSNPTSDEGSFIIGSVFETVNIIVSIIYFAIWPMPMIELSLISLCQQVRMAERSKAPDSRCYLFLSRWGFWSPHGGVGSNPTPDTSSFWIGSIFETVKHYSLYCLFCHLTNSNL